MGRARTQGGGILCLPFLITRSPDFLLFSVSPRLRGETSVGDVARSRRCQRSSLPLSFRAPSEFRNAERRQERNPEDVCSVNADARHFLENVLHVPSCPVACPERKSNGWLSRF